MRPFICTLFPRLRRGSVHVSLLISAVATVWAGSQPAYHLAKKYEIGGTAGWDYIAIDSGARRLYVPHVSEVDVLDADSGKLVGKISDTPGVHGVAVAPEFGKAFTTNGSAGTVSVINVETLAHTKEIKVGKDPDGIIYDPGTKLIFVSNGDSDSVSLIDPGTDQVKGTVGIGGGPEYLASDGKGRLWVNIQEKNSFVTIDVHNSKLLKTTAIPGCKAPTSLAADPANGRLFIGCRGGELAIVNAVSGKVIQMFPIGEHVDATVFDPDSQLILTSSGDGMITVVHQDSPGAYSLVGKVNTLRGAKTMVLDTKTKNLFLPTVENVPPGATGPPKGSGPGSYKAGAFEVLVVTP